MTAAMMGSGYVASLLSRGDTDLAELRRIATELVACVNEVANGEAELVPRVSETAALCGVLMGIGSTDP